MALRAKILFLTTTSDLGGAEHQLVDIVRRINPERFQPRVLSLQGSGLLTEAVREAGHPADTLHFKTVFLPLNLRRLTTILRTEAPEIVATCGLHADLLGRWAAHRAGVPIVISYIHGLEPERPFWRVWLDSWSGQWVNLFISVSEGGKRLRIWREAHPTEKVVVVPNGIDPDPPAVPEAAVLRDKYDLAPDDGPLVGLVGNLRPMKGHADAIRAAASLSKVFPRIRFLFAGRDDSNGKTPRFAELLGVSSHVRFLGYCDKVDELFSLFDVFLLPSHSEGCPLALLEAMRWGKPIVATRVGGIPEMVDHDVEALLIPPKSPLAIAEALRRLIIDRRLAEWLGEAARRRVREEFSLDQSVRTLESLLEEHLARVRSDSSPPPTSS